MSQEHKKGKWHSIQQTKRIPEREKNAMKKKKKHAFGNVSFLPSIKHQKKVDSKYTIVV